MLRGGWKLMGCFCWHRILVLLPHPAAKLDQKRLMSRGGRKLMGCVSGVASSSSRHILTVLSASADASREPDLGNTAHGQSDAACCKQSAMTLQLNLHPTDHRCRQPAVDRQHTAATSPQQACCTLE